MSIQINKILERKDGGNVPSGSVIHYNVRFSDEKMSVRYDIQHYVTQAKKDAGFQTITGVTNFSYIQIKYCTEEEYAKLDDAGAKELVQTWLQEIIDAKIGVEGKTEIV